MRNLTALAFAAAVLLAVTGCEERTNMRALPDRGGHAYRTGGAERPLPAGAVIPNVDETFHVVKSGDNLKKLCATYGVTEAWMIRRNRLQSHVLEVGSNLIVPKQAPAAK
jgi:hypothetical protein